MLRGVRATARVLLQGREVGRMAFESGSGEFVYTDDLLDPEHRVLGRIFEQTPRGRFAQLTGLPSWFANLLPEQGSGLRRYYAARFGSRTVDDARLLLSLGADLPGAVVVEPVDVPDEGVLVARAEARLDRDGLHLSSLPGAQLKMSVLRTGERLTLPAPGESGGWIAKFPDTLHRDLAENEHLMMRWVAVAGLDVPDTDLVPALDVPDIFDRHLPDRAAVYLVRRFDRAADGSRTHIEDLAQVNDIPPALRDQGPVTGRTTYDGIGRFLLAVTGQDDFAEYVRRLVAMVLMANEDAHLKNWSLWYPDGRTPRLAPVYDLVCTSFYSNLRRGLVFPLGGSTSTDTIGLHEFGLLAAAAGAERDGVADVVVATVRAMVGAWEAVRDRALSADLVDHVDARMRSHPLITQAR